MTPSQLRALKYRSAGPWQEVLHDCAESGVTFGHKGMGAVVPHPQPGILRCACCLKGLWNVEQILRALSAPARSPLASLESRGPAQELTEFHMEARNRGISCLSLSACPTHTLICRRPASQLLSCLSGCVCLTVGAYWCVLSNFFFFSLFLFGVCCSGPSLIVQ